MGAGQSSGRQAQGGAPEVKTSYYELLGVERSASDDELKKAYRRKALELHPDRNYGDVERTTSLFAQVQSAYEVLSDPQERAWYDAHEDAILRDVDISSGEGTTYEHNIGLTTADDLTRLLRRFNSNVPFTDSPSGFFGFLRETFAQLSKEEELAARKEGVEAFDYPSFGHKDDTHEAVARPFYAAWSSFSTCKTFAWRDKYRRTDAGDRWTRRAVDKENKRLRAEGVREFNDAVRSLVAFVRKRDPRFTPSGTSEEERNKILRDAAAAQAARSRRENLEKMNKEVLPEWVTASSKRQDEEDELEGSVGEEEESEEEQFECVACRKTFKSENQFEAHERSKKHWKQVAALKRKMRKEGVQLDIDEDGEAGEDSGAVTPSAQPEEEEQDESIAEEKLPSTNTRDISTTDSEQDDDADLANDTSSLHINGSSQTATVQDESSSEDERDTPQSPPPEEATPSALPQTQPSVPKMGKAAQKRAKRAAAATTNAPNGTAAAEHACARCGETFASKTKLFDHIRDLGHAAPISVTGARGGKKKGKR